MPEKDEPKRLRVIDGGDSPRAFAKRDGEDFEQLICRTCENDIGVATSHFLRTELAPFESRGEIIRSTPGLICVHCLSRGKITQLM